MAAQDIAAALRRVEQVLQRRPEAGLQDDEPAAARWEGGLRFAATHANGTRLLSDMPVELGGSGDQVMAGWMFRAGLASCVATCIVLAAAAQEIELAMLEVQTGSRMDLRSVLGMMEADGEPVRAGTRDLQLLVRISAQGVPPERLRALVDEGLRRSPSIHALRYAVPVVVRIEDDAG